MTVAAADQVQDFAGDAQSKEIKFSANRKIKVTVTDGATWLTTKLEQDLETGTDATLTITVTDYTAAFKSREAAVLLEAEPLKEGDDVNFPSAKATINVTQQWSEGLSANAILYSFPSNAPAATTYAVKLDGQTCYVYPVPRRSSSDGSSGLNARVATFGITGEVEVKVKVTSTTAVSSVKIRPLSAGITPVVSDNIITFTLNKPQNLSIEVNGNISSPLFVFANAPETDIPDKNDPNVIFFEAGTIHTPGTFTVASNQTVYIAPGAIVKGEVKTDKTNNVRIMGRGILSGETAIHGQVRMIEINRAQNVLVEGITIVASPHWTIPLTACENAEVRDVKIVGDADWDDGIDVVGSKNITVDNCFIRTKDDCVAVKSGVDYFTDFDSQIKVENIRVKNSTLWNGTYGNGLEIGFETRADSIKDVIFENIDIIHVQGSPSNEAALTIHNGDRAVVDNILYKNIRIEDASSTLIDLRILQSEYSKDTERGRISNIRFEDITVIPSRKTVNMIGFDSSHAIENIHFKNCTISGVKITKVEDFSLNSQFLSNLTVE
ncbi:hypothetical protein AGMMS49965_21660 [Bacteroidia bacterium]|nr:hypothetical protein AGMMS49965_21660 [Bacteroidia bacterium]